MIERRKSIDEAGIAALLKSGNALQLHAARANLIELKKSVEIQVASDSADRRDNLANALTSGAGYDDACRRSFMESDHDWRARATGLLQIADKLIAKINARLHELGGGSKSRSAVTIAGAGRTSTLAAEALNALLQRGCLVLAFSTVGGDLVVVATEPTTPAGGGGQ